MNTKRSIVLFLVILLNGSWNNANILKSQQYVNPGAEWVFWNNVDGGGYMAYRRWKYTEDITIDTLNYQKISVTSRNSIPYSPYFPDVSGGYTPLVTQNPFLFRSSGDSLFIAEIDGSNERLLYDFTPVIGNTWDASPFIYWITIEPTSPLTIETTAFGDTIINGQTVNWVDVTTNNPDSLIFSGRIYYHFGKNQVFPFWDDRTLHNGPLTWKCYRDDILGSIGVYPCIDIETLDIEHLEDTDISLIPNYQTKSLEFLFKNKEEIEYWTIQNISGKVIATEKYCKTNSIEFDHPTGVYIITIKFFNYIYSEKFYWSNK